MRVLSEFATIVREDLSEQLGRVLEAKIIVNSIREQGTFRRLAMQIDHLSESELKEILVIAQEGESKLKEMSDRATILSEKWRVKTSTHKNSNLAS